MNFISNTFDVFVLYECMFRNVVYVFYENTTSSTTRRNKGRKIFSFFIYLYVYTHILLTKAILLCLSLFEKEIMGVRRTTMRKNSSGSRGLYTHLELYFAWMLRGWSIIYHFLLALALNENLSFSLIITAVLYARA